MENNLTKNPNILFINPPFQRLLKTIRPYIPYGLLYLASYLENKGFKTKVYNADLKINRKNSESKSEIFKEANDVIKNELPDIVGIGFQTPQYNSALETAKIVKNLNDNIPIIVGGIHPTFMADETAREKYFDIVVRREGEVTVLELINALIDNRSLKDVKGITYKENSSIISTADRPLIQDLDSIPFPNRELLLNKNYYPHAELGIITLSRGCPYSCSFCASKAFWGFRTRTPKNIVDEIEYLKKKYHLAEFWLEGDTFLINRSHVSDLCLELKSRKLNILWGGMARVDQINKELIKDMKSCGLCNISLGVESGSQKILDITKKGITVDQVKKAVKILKAEGIFVNTYWMIGFQEETQETLNETKKLIKKLNPHLARTFILTPFPGTEEYEKAKRKNRLLSEDWSQYHVGNPYLIKRPDIDNEIIKQEYYGDFKDIAKKEVIQWISYLLFHPKLITRKFLEVMYQLKDN